MHLRVRHNLRNEFSIWLGTAATMAVGFFLSPFLVHRLGNEAYGIWVLAISSISYLGALDLGMRSSVLRFVSKGHTTGDHEAASAALSGALWVRLQISVVVLLLSGILAYLFPILFKVPPDLAHSARIAVSIIGFNLALTMSLGVFGGVISGLNRYDLQTVVTLVQMVIRVAGVVIVLHQRRGIVAIAFCELLAALGGNVLLLVIARRIYPELRVLFTRPSPDVLRSLWSYSFYAFLTTVALQLVYQTDNLVVGTFVSASMVTFYAIGNSLCRYTDQFTGAMTMSFVPAASTFEAAGNTAKLRSLYTVGTRSMMALYLPILTTLLVRGRTFIGLWMGPQYAHISGTVLMILGTALVVSQANNTAFAIAFGTERNKIIAKWALAEGAANLTLSILLVRWLGIYGVAVGTLIPNLAIHLIFWPRYVSKLVGMRSWEVIGTVWMPMLLSAVPFSVASYWVNVTFPAKDMLIFFAQTAALLPIFLLAVSLVFRDQLKSRIYPAARAFVQAKMELFAH